MAESQDEAKWRARAVQHADELLSGCAALRADLRAYESAVRRVRARTIRANADETVVDVSEFIAVRSRVTDSIDALETRRRDWRVSLFHLQVDAGMSLAQIARQWGVSRQLVSRLINDDGAIPVRSAKT
jgi:hypothetical protein